MKLYSLFRYTIREEILPHGVLSDLSIRTTGREDSALFTCVATNSFGSDDTIINLIVQGMSLLFNGENITISYLYILFFQLLNNVDFNN